MVPRIRLELYEVPRIIPATLNYCWSYAGYLKLYRLPRIILELFCSSTRGVLLPFLFFPQTIIIIIIVSQMQTQYCKFSMDMSLFLLG